MFPIVSLLYLLELLCQPHSIFMGAASHDAQLSGCSRCEESWRASCRPAAVRPKLVRLREQGGEGLLWQVNPSSLRASLGSGAATATLTSLSGGLLVGSSKDLEDLAPFQWTREREREREHRVEKKWERGAREWISRKKRVEVPPFPASFCLGLLSSLLNHWEAQEGWLRAVKRERVWAKREGLLFSALCVHCQADICTQVLLPVLSVLESKINSWRRFLPRLFNN